MLSKLVLFTTKLKFSWGKNRSIMIQDYFFSAGADRQLQCENFASCNMVILAKRSEVTLIMRVALQIYNSITVYNPRL